MNTTLEAIRAQSPCTEGWLKLTKHLNRETGEVSFVEILESNGIEDAIWCLCVLPYCDRRLFMADVAESVLHIFEAAYPDDDRPRKAIVMARNLDATDEELRDAYADARAAAAYADAADAADAAYAAWAAAYADAADAADAAYAAAYEYAAAAAAAAANVADAAAAVRAAVRAAAAASGNWTTIETLFRKHY